MDASNNAGDTIATVDSVAEDMRVVCTHRLNKLQRYFGYFLKVAGGFVVGYLADKRLEIPPAITLIMESTVIGIVAWKEIPIMRREGRIRTTAARDQDVVIDAAKFVVTTGDDMKMANAIVELTKETLQFAKEDDEMRMQEGETNDKLDTLLRELASDDDEDEDDEEEELSVDPWKEKHAALRERNEDIEKTLGAMVERESREDIRRGTLRRSIIQAFAESMQMMRDADYPDGKYDHRQRAYDDELERHNAAIIGMYEACMDGGDLVGMQQIHDRVEEEYVQHLSGFVAPDDRVCDILTAERDLLILRKCRMSRASVMDTRHRELGRHIKRLSEFVLEFEQRRTQERTEFSQSLTAVA